MLFLNLILYLDSSFWGYDTVYSGKWCTDLSDHSAWNHRRTYSKPESHENITILHCL